MSVHLQENWRMMQNVQCECLTVVVRMVGFCRRCRDGIHGQQDLCSGWCHFSRWEGLTAVNPSQDRQDISQVCDSAHQNNP